MTHVVKRSRRVVRRPWFDSCQDCRTRKVKCDATRPSCMRCQKAGRKCSYAIWVVGITTSEPDNSHPYEPQSKVLPTSPPLVVEVQHIPRMSALNPSKLEAGIRISFEFYMHVGLEAQTQFSTHPPAVRNGARYALNRAPGEPIWTYLLATAGAAWQARLPLVHTGIAQPLDMSKYDVARAIFAHTLRESWDMRSRTETYDAIEPLIMFLMQLSAFEIVTGSHISAIPYLRHMRAILESSTDSRARNPAPGTVLGTLARGSLSALNDESMPHRLGFVSGSAKCQDPNLITLLHEGANLDHSSFNSQEEACISLEYLLGCSREIELGLLRAGQEYLWTTHFELAGSLDECTRSCIALCLSRVVDLDAQLSRQIRKVTEGHRFWRSKYAVFLEQNGRAPTSAMLFLQVRAFSSLLFLMTCRLAREGACNKFTHDIAATVSAAGQYFEKRRKLEPDNLPSEPGDAPRTSNLLEWGMLHALYQLCAKCRDPSVRRKACRLLSTARRREGPLESGTLAVYARAIIQLEEQSAGDIPKETFALPGLFADAVPEHARLSDIVALSRPNDAGYFRLVCGRFKHEERGQIEVCGYQFFAKPTNGDGEAPFIIVEEAGGIELSWSTQRRPTSNVGVKMEDVAPLEMTLPFIPRSVVV